MFFFLPINLFLYLIDVSTNTNDIIKYYKLFCKSQKKFPLADSKGDEEIQFLVFVLSAEMEHNNSKRRKC